jgi:hypothetical protein
LLFFTISLPQNHPAATLKPSSIKKEKESIRNDNLTNTQYSKPGWFSDPGYATNTKIAGTKNAACLQKIGPNVILKVMPAPYAKQVGGRGHLQHPRCQWLEQRQHCHQQYNKCA